MWSLFKKTQSKQWIERQARVTLLEDQGIEAVVDGKHLKILNISVKGLAISLNEPIELTLGGELKTQIILGGKEKFSIQTKVRHVTDKAVGLEVVSENVGDFTTFVSDFFSSEINALSMREIEQESVKQDPRGETRWWNGGEDYDLYIVGDEDKLISFNLSFQGQVIVGGAGLQTVIGDKENENERFKQFSGSEIIYNAQPLEPKLSKSLERFFNNVPNISDALKESLIKCIQ